MADSLVHALEQLPINRLPVSREQFLLCHTRYLLRLPTCYQTRRSHTRFIRHPLREQARPTTPRIRTEAARNSSALLLASLFPFFFHQHRTHRHKDEIEDQHLRALSIGRPDVPLKHRVRQTSTSK